MVNVCVGIFRSTVFKCVSLPSYTSVCVYLYSCGNLFLWTSAKWKFITLKSALRFIYIVFGIQIAVGYHSAQILQNLSELNIKVLVFEIYHIKYYDTCFSSGFNAKIWRRNALIKKVWLVINLLIGSFLSTCILHCWIRVLFWITNVVRNGSTLPQTCFEEYNSITTERVRKRTTTINYNSKTASEL